MSDEDLKITYMRLCECGKPDGHADACLRTREAKQRQPRVERERPAIFDAEMAAVLLRLELVSWGSTQAWNASGGQSGEPDDKTVSAVLAHDHPPYLLYRDLYERQRDAAGQAFVLEAARAELRTLIRRTTEGPIQTMSLNELILEDGRGFDARTVAQRYGVAEDFVVRLRRKAGCRTDDGREVKVLVGEDKIAKALDLRRQGLSTRKIAEAVGAHQTQVMRWIRDRAA